MIITEGDAKKEVASNYHKSISISVAVSVSLPDFICIMDLEVLL